MKKLNIKRRYILQMIAASVAALGVLSGSAQATPMNSAEYTVNGTLVTGAGTNTSSAYFLDAGTTGYTISVASGRQPG